MKILLLEDDLIIATQIKEYFELFGNIVKIFINGEDLLQKANPKSYDILILDINTPGASGLEVLEVLKKLNLNIPTIFITAMSEIKYLKKAFLLGANDYIKKPFDLEELEVRIDKILTKQKSKIDFSKGYIFDLNRQKLFKNNKEINLNKNEQKILYLLAKNIGEIVSNETIKEYVWENKEVCNNTLRTTIKKLRDKLKIDFIKNLRGVGYKVEISKNN